MTRISTTMLSQNALLDMQKAQKNLFEVSSQTASQKKGDDLQAYGRQSQTLVSANRLAARYESRIQSSAELETRLTIQNAALERASEIVSELKQSLTENIGLNDGTGIDLDLNQAFASLKDVFNTSIGGRYLFGGTMNDQPPVSSASLADLAANPITDAFVQGAQPQEVKLDSVQTVEIAPVAADIAQDAFDLLKRLKTFSDGANGPFNGELTDAQSTALSAEISALETINKDMIQTLSNNGRVHNLVETNVERQTKQLNALQESIGEITDVDLAEVAVKLNQAQLSYQASASVFNTVRGLTLLDVLR